ncbi:topoisomerase [Lentibacillus cibarius]|uniref:Topoisomerase n=1 Tax=Lentibacillus cibarius TaxID=2583219 RepID=A0A549YMI8_9BACI|nr:toprim domain-containing protein [Lentibacillus cibarius]TMN21281.1 topoisomerase [Lentibacillus cibarius]TRM13067.1 topoisomerase [Lentibacillus cibarius]
MTHDSEKVIIVEGLTDKQQIKKVLTDDAEIVCTNGTLSVEKLDELLDTHDLDNRDVYILVDEDDSGNKIRRQLTHELPHARHIHVNSEFREVAATPVQLLAEALVGEEIAVNPIFLA